MAVFYRTTTQVDNCRLLQYDEKAVLGKSISSAISSLLFLLRKDN